MKTPKSTFYRVAIGSDDCKDLIQSGDYVDKSLFFHDILHDKHKVFAITRSRRWGKSSNMSLLKNFLELEVDKAGKPLPDEQNKNLVYFTGGVIQDGKRQITHAGLKISQEADSRVSKSTGSI